METKNQDEAVLKTFSNTQYSNHFTVPPIGLSGGLVLSWQDHVDLDILDSSPNFIDVQVTSGPDISFITFIYGVPRQEDRASLWEKLTLLGTGRDNAWLVTGDFNDLLNSSEKVGGPVRWEGSFVAFRSFVTQAGLWDLQHTGNHLSWRGTQYNHFIQSRLDRAMGNCKWSESFPASYCEYLSFEGSDHRPLLTRLDNTQKKRRNLFLYDRRLTSKSEIRDIVNENWSLCHSNYVLSRLCRVRQAIINWTKEQNHNSKANIQSLQLALDVALSSLLPNTDLIGMLTSELDKAYAEEESYWRQRSRILWLQHGDKNSSYLHTITRGRKLLNKFSVLEKQDGTSVYEEGQIAETIASYYTSLFTSTSNGNPQMIAEVVKPCISTSMNDSLIGIPDDMEIKRVVFTIHGDKAPGPYGFSVGFYQGFWDILGKEVCRDIKGFFETGKLHRG